MPSPAAFPQETTWQSAQRIGNFSAYRSPIESGWRGFAQADPAVTLPSAGGAGRRVVNRRYIGILREARRAVR